MCVRPDTAALLEGPDSSSPRGGLVVKGGLGTTDQLRSAESLSKDPGSTCLPAGQPRCPPPLHCYPCTHPPPSSSLRREKCGDGSRVIPMGCCSGMRSPGEDAAPDASQPQLGRGGGGAEPQTEATVAGETQAGGGEPGACPPPELYPGPAASHPLRYVRACARAQLTAGLRRPGQLRPGCPLARASIGSQVWPRHQTWLPPPPPPRLPWSTGLRYHWVWPPPAQRGLLLTAQYLKLLGCQLPWGEPVTLGHSGAPAPAQRGREGAQQMFGVMAAVPPPPSWRTSMAAAVSVLPFAVE